MVRGSVRIAVLLPTFDEPALLATLASVRDERGDASVTVFVVDDGSRLPVLRADLQTLLAPGEPGFALVLARHRVNLGQGAALETARRLALGRASRRSGPFDAYVTMDADGQHRAADLAALVRPLASGADVVFGNRFTGGTEIPRVRALVLRAARLLEWALTGLRLGDAHNGFRAFDERGIRAVQMHQRGMAHATEIRQEVARAGLVVAEAPVRVRYDQASLAKGQRSWGALAILRDILYQYLFAGVS